MKLDVRSIRAMHNAADQVIDQVRVVPLMNQVRCVLKLLKLHPLCMRANAQARISRATLRFFLFSNARNGSLNETKKNSRCERLFLNYPQYQSP